MEINFAQLMSTVILRAGAFVFTVLLGFGIGMIGTSGEYESYKLIALLVLSVAYIALI